MVPWSAAETLPALCLIDDLVSQGGWHGITGQAGSSEGLGPKVLHALAREYAATAPRRRELGAAGEGEWGRAAPDLGLPRPGVSLGFWLPLPFPTFSSSGTGPLSQLTTELGTTRPVKRAIALAVGFIQRWSHNPK